MNKKLLFSPIGGTDPIRYLRDGSMLHICRQYKPDIIYLYLSHEMLENHKKDDRYVKSIELLGKKIEHNFEIHIIERDDLIAAQHYDTFYFNFKEEISIIENSMDSTDQLILNMASGTPAMKSALLIIATLAKYRFLLVQVDSPLKKMNSENEQREPFDIGVNFELDEDNEEGSENRCKEIECLHLMHLLKIDIIKKHLSAYDYHAALALAYEIKDDINTDAYLLIKVADNRVKLNSSENRKLLSEKNYNIFPIQAGNQHKLFEYALVLQMKIQKGEYADFVRGITPIIIDLLEVILRIQCKFELDDYTNKERGMRTWNIDKLKKADVLEILNDKFSKSGGFKGGIIYSSAIGSIIQYKTKDEVLKQKVIDIVKVESQVRNIAAHEIISVTDEWIREKTGKDAKEILKIIKYLIVQAGINAKEQDWKSYDQMNDLIESILR